MLTLPDKTKLELFNVLKKELHFDNQETIIDFLNEIWSLQDLPSEDERFENAYDDAFQHLINNDDWSIEYLFVDRFKVLNSDAAFNKFIEAILKPEYRKSEDEIIRLVLVINPYLEKEGYILRVSDYLNGDKPIYKIQIKSGEDETPFDLKENLIPFIVEKTPFGPTYIKFNHRTPKNSPCFVLVFNNGWNDYFKYKTTYSLFYYDESFNGSYIGEVKILSTNDDHSNYVIPDEFLVLDETFCSLGQTNEYYLNLKQALNRDLASILYALRDIAFFPEFQEDVKKQAGIRNSLTRTDTAERLLREAKYIVYGNSALSLYRFQYNFQPLFANNVIQVEFEFDNETTFPNRVYAIIGKNGTGKTQLITSLPVDIANKMSDRFTPNVPFFSKVIAVSYSIFDRFTIPKKSTTFNYVYCGIRNENNVEISERSRTLRFHIAWKKIQGLERIDKWRNVLLNFIDEEIIDQFLVRRGLYDNSEGENLFRVDLEGYNKIKNMLSSGQSIVLYIISEIVANIRFDSLLLFDEPETHLHPNAITQLMNTVYELVNEFQSYCIITTHSPLIVREVLSKNVYIMERHMNLASIRKIGVETFGENLSVITEEVFGNKEIPKHYKTVIQELVANSYSFDQIVSLLESDDVPLSLNAKIYIDAMLNK